MKAYQIRRAPSIGVAVLAFFSSCRSGDPTGPSGSIARAWYSPATNATQDWVGGTPAVDAGRVFAQEGFNVIGMDAASGSRLWTRRVRVAAVPPPTTLLAGEGRVFVSETDSIMALDASSGATIWSVHPDSQTVTVPALDSDALYTGQRGIPVGYAVGRTGGTVKWKVNVGGGYQFPAHVRGVAVSGDTVYATVERYLNSNGGTSSGVIVALERQTGREFWRYETPSGKHFFQDAPVPSSGLVIASDFGVGDLIAVSTTTRQEVWRVPAGGSTRILVSGGRVLTAGFDHHAYAFDLATGKVLWSEDTGGSAYGLGRCGGSVFVSAGVLRRYDVSSGQLTGEAGVAVSDGAFVTNPVSDGTRLYLSGSGGMYAFQC